MNKKKLLSIGSIALGAVLLASCANTNYKVKFSENWYLDTTYDIRADATETLVYEVGFAAGANADTQYRALNYGKGTYTTTLKSEYSESEGAYIYRYTTKLEIPVSFECKTTGEISETMTDTVTSEVLFKSAMQGLKPISSTKTFVNHSPTTVDEPTALEQCYTYYHYTVDTTYDENLNGTSVQTNHLKDDEKTTTNFESANDDYSTLDNEQLLFAIRGINSLSSQKFNVYNNSWKVSQLVALTASSASSDEFTFKKGETETKATISYTPVTLKLDVGNSGAEQTVWVSSTTELNNNVYRNVILYMEMPLFYTYGTFEYKLVQANFIGN